MHFLKKYVYLELILQFLFNPLGHMAESHLPLPQFGTDMQIQLGWHTEAVPTQEIITYNFSHYCFLYNISKTQFNIKVISSLRNV